jgi:FtsH-binding integral membrane protein
MEYREFDRMVNEVRDERDLTPSITFPALMQKVYTWMAFAMIITGITAYGVANSPSLLGMIYTNPVILWGLIIAELALVFGITGMINRVSLTTATLMFVAYSVINGAMLSSIFLVYTMNSIGQVFFITSATFGVMAFIGYTTKTDLTSMGKILFMALIGMIIATVVNIFVGSTGLQTVTSYLGVLIFVGLTAYDSQKIKHMLYEQEVADEGAQKLALIGALTLYLDFINLFLYLLRIMGSRRD